MTMRRVSMVFQLSLLAVLALAPGSEVCAQGPSAGPVRLVVGAAPGGSISVYARIVADHMAATLGQTLIVENKPGANGNIAAQFVADASADGSAIWVGTQSMVEINPSAYKSLRWKSADFIPVIKGIESPLMLSTHPSVPAKTLAELVAWVKSNPKKLSYRVVQRRHALAFPRFPDERALRPRLGARALSRRRAASHRSGRRSRAARLHAGAGRARARACRSAERDPHHRRPARPCGPRPADIR